MTTGSVEESCHRNFSPCNGGFPLRGGVQVAGQGVGDEPVRGRFVGVTQVEVVLVRPAADLGPVDEVQVEPVVTHAGRKLEGCFDGHGGSISPAGGEVVLSGGFQTAYAVCATALRSREAQAESGALRRPIDHLLPSMSAEPETIP